MSEPMVRIPPLPDLYTAAAIYYSTTQLRSCDIKKLFGGIGNEKAKRLKDRAKEYCLGRGYQIYNEACVPTDAAFEAWGLDIKQIERKIERAGRYIGNGSIGM